MTPAEQAKLASIIVELSQMIGPTQGPTPPVIQPPLPPVTPPSVPVAGSVIECSVQMNGQPTFVSNFIDQTVICTLVVPDWPVANPNTIAVYEYQGAPTFRRAWLSKTRGDMSASLSPFYQVGQGPVFQYCINGTAPDAVHMIPGETWYLMIRNERPFPPYLQSHGGTDCPIGIKWYPPN